MQMERTPSAQAALSWCRAALLGLAAAVITAGPIAAHDDDRHKDKDRRPQLQILRAEVRLDEGILLIEGRHFIHSHDDDDAVRVSLAGKRLTVRSLTDTQVV